jgi:hypothetical protein
MSHQEKSLAIMVAYESYEDEDGVYFIFDNETLSAHRLKLREHQCDLFFCGNLMILGVGEEPYAFDLRDIARAERISNLYQQGGIVRFAFKNDRQQIIPVMSVRQNQMATSEHAHDKVNMEFLDFDSNPEISTQEIESAQDLLLENTQGNMLDDMSISTQSESDSLRIANEMFEKKESSLALNKKKSPLVSHSYRMEKPTAHFEFELFELENKGLLFEVYEYEAWDIVNPEQPLKMAFKQEFLRIETQEKYFLFNITGFSDYDIKAMIDTGSALTIHFIKNNHIDQEFFFKANNRNRVPEKPTPALGDKEKKNENEKEKELLSPIHLTVPLVSSSETKESRLKTKKKETKPGEHFYTIRYGSDTKNKPSR